MAKEKVSIDFRARGEAREYAGRLAVPVLLALALVAVLAYAALTYGREFFFSRLLASTFFIAGMIIGAVILLIIFRLYVRWRFLNRVVARSLKASEKNLPGIYRLAGQAAARLGMEAPGVYVMQDPEINAYAMGLRRKIVVLNTGLIDAAGEDELAFILGHELAHVKYGWSVPLRILGITIPVPLIAGSQAREYTCDRGGLLASRRLEPALRALAKLALGKALAEKIDVNQLYTSKKEADEDRISRLSEALATHPPIRDRVLQLRQFYGSDLYRQLQQDH